ncbi:uncharacterized protein BYT42DRAFT_556024 [Radiomyces spectabilis]|uniref:uncharacterized protein n=1 Tax=Radiomyces spectabilis TaxID=64574 RepID=UPI002220FF8F|nr:uncharacterized protein BYT42DRAFT_556024 [Radiomyces spectabilis]KAI8391203.1 hypothetical protein BYT42DRAFT_556024 [Radiomyces spectabilis]
MNKSSSSSLNDRHLMMILAGTLGLGALAWLLKNQFTSKTVASTKNVARVPKQKTESIADKMKNEGRRVCIFYGSQTGTAEDFASRLGKQCKQKGIEAIVADIEQHDMSCLDQIPSDSLVVFVVATYGEGEPTDNAVKFWDLLHAEQPEFSQGTGDDQPLNNLRYFVFGLGNSSYTYFNGAARVIDEKLRKFGATRLGERGEGDDDADIEDDFLAWQEQFWPLLAENLGVTANEEADTVTVSTYVAEEIDACENPHLGELGDATQTIWDVKKPYPALVTTKDMTATSDRHCMHIDLDITGSGISYQTGDHLGVWPTNSEDEVIRVAALFGLKDKLDKIISVQFRDQSASKKSPFPSPTSYLAMFRHYLEICQLPSRPTLSLLVDYAPNDACKELLKTLADDKEEHRRVVQDGVRNLAETLEYCLSKSGVDGSAKEGAFSTVPLDILVECFSRLQPRYYSISSSSSESPDVISITAVTLSYNPAMAPDRMVYGVNTNYLWAVHNAIHNTAMEKGKPVYMIDGPSGQYYDQKLSMAKIPVHVRRSNFKLPVDTRAPVIMVGPGTGIAPFRGFVHERAYQAKQGQPVGPTILYFGCRRSTEDFLYAEEWPELFEQLPSPSRIITAFSRETDAKVYVQHRLKENGAEMWDLLEKKAYFYVCGDAKRMAKDVSQTVMEFAKEFGGLDDAKATEYVDMLRKTGRYQEDVWA